MKFSKQRVKTENDFDIIGLLHISESQKCKKKKSKIDFFELARYHSRLFIYTTTFPNNIFSGNILAKIADHQPRFISIQRMKPDLYKSKTFKRDYKNFNEDSYLNDLARQWWGNHIPDVNDKYAEFITKLDECTNRHVSIRELSRKEQKLKTKPWITNFILKKITHRNRLFVKRNPNNADLIMAYNLFRTSVTRDIKTSKRNYYASYFENCKNNMNKKHGKVFVKL